MKFLDQAKIHVKSGKGGHGCVSFRREKFVEFGGPNGGNGGKGGNIIALAVENLNTLIDFRYQQHIKAKNGRPGMGNSRTGASGENVTIKVPVGTQILDENRTTILADMVKAGQQMLLARGGLGGKGNESFKTSTNRAPRQYEPGGEPEEYTLWLHLKLIADAGLIGLPNAGKSTLLSSVSRARPKIGDYPFTTLFPNLGVAQTNGREIVLADIPGLVKGAREGAGLGHRFLGHIERCQILLHLVDGTTDDVVASYRTVRNELGAYNKDLTYKEELICLNKCDALSKDLIKKRREALVQATQLPVYVVSGVTGLGLANLLSDLNQSLNGTDTQDGSIAKSNGWQP